MTDINNTINVPQPGSPRFQSDTAKAIGRIRASLGGEGRPYFETLTLGGLTADALVYGDSDQSLQSVTLSANLSFSAPTLDTVQGIQTTSSPTFAGLTITNCCVLGSNSAVFQPSTDSATFFKVMDADGGTAVLDVDSTNERVGVGTDAPSLKFDVKGSPNTTFTNCPLLVQFHTTDAYADGMGGGISLGGMYDATHSTTFGYIAGVSDGGVDGDTAGKLILGARPTGGGAADMAVITIHGTKVTEIGDGGTANYMEISGTGGVLFKGSSGLAYGSMYSISDMAVTMTTQNVWKEIDVATAWITGKLNNCTFTDPYLVATNAGTYLVTWNIVGRIGTANQVVEVGIMVDQTVTDNPANGAAGVQGEGRGAVEFLNAARRLGTSGSAILTLAAGKKVSLALRNTTSAGKILTVSKGNLKIVQIGG